VKEPPLEVEGTVVEALRNQFRIEISPDINKKKETTNKIFVLAVLSGKLRKNKIRVVVGDCVKVEVSPYDFSRGRITYRVQ
tara:strand:+ start:72 stop:314 length:243 start_codon:yes stop_codon:yes gene_type:complete